MVIFVFPLPLPGVTVVGENAQVAAAGNPEQLNPIAELNVPPTAATVVV